MCDVSFQSSYTSTYSKCLLKFLCDPSVTCARSLFKRTEDEYIPDAESVRQAKEQHLQPQTCSLAQCFQLYTKEEQVGPGHGVTEAAGECH